MLKVVNYVFMGSQRLLHTSDNLLRWYLSHLKKKHPIIPAKNPPVFNFDWENKRFKFSDGDDILTIAKELDGFGSLDKAVKPAFSYAFQPIRYDYENQRKQLLESFGFNSYEKNLSTEVIDLTIRLRYKKALLDRHPRNYALRGATEGLIVKRHRALRNLRSRNMEEFDRLTRGLSIDKFIFVDPFDKMDLNESNLRTIEVSSETYKKRLAKIARLKADLVKEKEIFFKEIKPQKMKRVRELLSELLDEPIANERLDKLISSVFEEVLRERKTKLLKGPMNDQLYWYYDEEKQRKKVQKIIAEKAARRMSQKR